MTRETSPFLPEDVAACAEIQRRNATSYSLATRLFPKIQREATQVFYAFVRVADDLVDEPQNPDPAEIEQALSAWMQRWEAAYASGTSDDPVLRANAVLFHEYGIPKAYADAFFASMRADIGVTRYETYDSLLNDYVYGSASVIGLTMCHICKTTDPVTLGHARSLGDAMQLTNFLRDIREDFSGRGRIYLPVEAMTRFGVTDEDIAQQRVTPGFTLLMQECIAKARVLFADGEAGIPRLPAYARPGVRLAKVLYERILLKIEHHQYDVFRHRARTSDPMKLALAARVLLLGR